MENLILSFNIMAPVFIMMALGYFLKSSKLCGKNTIDQMNSISFKIFMPVLLFNNIYKADIKGAFNPKLLIFAICSVIIIFLLLMLIIPLIEKDNKKRGVLVQGIFRSNFVIFGLPISIALCGSENLGPISILIAVIVPIYNALSVIGLEIFRGKGINILRIIKSVLKNPFIISGAIGLIFLGFNIELPNIMSSTVNSISSIATPLALILLGASFNFTSVKGNLRNALIATAGKLVVIPMIFIPICIMFGFRNIELASLVIMIGAPTAVSSFTMAGQMDGDQDLAGQIVVFDSVGAIFTMFLWIFILKQLAYF